jgi:hypothetical protein
VIVSIHQPHFLPWPGYMNKLLRSDVFVWLDNVQYRKNYFQNRTEIRTHRGERAWLTVPVRAPFGTPIDEVVAADPGWAERVRARVEQEYHHAPHFDAVWPRLEAALAADGDRLTDIDRRCLDALLGLIGGERPRIVGIRELGVSATDPTGRLVEACRALGATRYIAGKGGRNYLDVEAFEKAGIEVVWQAFDPQRFAYPQPGEPFLPGLSIIDCLFHAGAETAGRLLRESWAP